MDKLMTTNAAIEADGTDEWDASMELTPEDDAAAELEDAAFMAENPGLGTGMLDY